MDELRIGLLLIQDGHEPVLQVQLPLERPVAERLCLQLSLARHNRLADLSPLLAAPSISDLIPAVTAAFAAVQATNFPERAEAPADEIAATRPDLIGSRR